MRMDYPEEGIEGSTRAPDEGRRNDGGQGGDRCGYCWTNQENRVGKDSGNKVLHLLKEGPESQQ